jgi:archaellum biogenesis protein FlaJ (TadC family)
MRARRSFSSAFKAKVVLECISGEKSISKIALAYQLILILVNKWRTDFTGACHVISGKDIQPSISLKNPGSHFQVN